MGVILPSLSNLKSGIGCSLALIVPPATTAPKESTKMPIPFTSLPIIARDFFAGSGVASAAASAIVSIPSAARLPQPSIEQVLCHTSLGLFLLAFPVGYDFSTTAPRAGYGCCADNLTLTLTR